MVFEGNPGFIFHDSRGFEAGDAEELNLVRRFIEQRSKAKKVNEQLHAIWCVCLHLETTNFLMQANSFLSRYCIPTSDDRPITKAEKMFFNDCGTGPGKYHLIKYVTMKDESGLREVPVIVLWTKTDSLDDDKIIQLMDEGSTMSEAKQQAPQKAWAEYEENIHPHFVRFKYPPKAHVIFRSKCYTYFYCSVNTHLANCVVQRCMSLELIAMT